MSSRHVHFIFKQIENTTNAAFPLPFPLLFWYHFGPGSKRAEPILKGDTETPQTTDWSESLLVTRIILSLRKINMSMATALWSPDERASELANKATQKQITLVSAVVLCDIIYVTLHYIGASYYVAVVCFTRRRYDDRLRIPPTLRGYYLQWKTKSRKVPGTKSQSSRVESSHAIQWKRG